ncbi:uncharacterized protein PADG_12017 [Paracoccidioides brasiliensis Pb18]|uniref:nitrilase n=1 Tax=Paracoccidioides brasiliensis (strain Pb18) TaxID=502780 RepID=A0A0A0HV17_PARBD|nr:uncharacterized protein PADG_12017 [Paracoccidioides brasiliensis Pb18]KGM91876.1 hypothetical protein PADG_12017 [Paracoccidioides brasiliensis Pb18]
MLFTNNKQSQSTTLPLTPLLKAWENMEIQIQGGDGKSTNSHLIECTTQTESRRQIAKAKQMPGPILRVAITQAEPVYLDLDATVEKTVKIIEEAAQGGAKLIAFPECWIPGYPGWIW